MAARQRTASHTDVAGAVLIVVGIVGGVAWAWDVVRSQFGDDEPGSLGARLDLLTDTTLVLLLAGLVAGLGLQLRTLAAERTGSRARSVLERPVGPMLLVLGGLLLVLIGGAALVGDRDDEPAYSNALNLDPPVVDNPPLVFDDLSPIVVPGLATSAELSDSLYTLEVHSDGCGVFRSGNIGDDLTWSVKDRDGFQVLGRNAAGETQYRYFQPGTYTVTLETWGGSYYVDVSNEVTITC